MFFHFCREKNNHDNIHRISKIKLTVRANNIVKYFTRKNFLVCNDSTYYNGGELAWSDLKNIALWSTDLSNLFIEPISTKELRIKFRILKIFKTFCLFFIGININLRPIHSDKVNHYFYCIIKSNNICYT